MMNKRTPSHIALHLIVFATAYALGSISYRDEVHKLERSVESWEKNFRIKSYDLEECMTDMKWKVEALSTCTVDRLKCEMKGTLPIETDHSSTEGVVHAEL